MSAQASDESLAPAGVPDFRPDVKEVQQLNPIQMWDKPSLGQTESDLYDFRPRPEEDIVEEEDDGPDPKASSAAGSALAAIYETVRTPDYTLSPTSPASAETDSGQDKGSESGQQSSSTTPETKSGNDEPPA